MRYLLPILLLITFSCVKTSTEVLSKPQALSVTDSLPNVYIPKNETGWNRGEYFGIGSFYLRVTNTALGKRFTYNCPLAATGADFVVCMSCRGVPDSTVYGGYRYKGMLRIRLYRNGLKEYDTYKDVYQLENTDERVGFVLTRDYGQDTMFISNGAADNYYNSVYLTGDGVQHVLVNWNYNGDWQDSNPNDDSQILGVNINGLTAVLDTSLPLKPIPVSNISYQYIRSTKRVILTFNGHGEDVSIYKDGIYLAQSNASYTDEVGARWKQSVYTFIKEVKGIGNSNPVSIIAKK